MKDAFIKPILFSIFIFLLFSCSDHKRECFLSYSPYISYVGFDTADFDTFYVKQYNKCCNFDSLISIDTNYSWPALTEFFKDTFAFPHMYYPSGSASYGRPNFNWKIILQNNVEIQLSNIELERNKCESYGDPPCICTIKSYEINTINCTNSIDHQYDIIYIHK